MMRIEEALCMLIVEDSNHVSKRLKGLFNTGDVKINTFHSLDKLDREDLTHNADILLLTSTVIREKEKAALELIRKIIDRYPRLQVLFLVEQADIKLATQLLKYGIYHYTRLPVSDEELKLLVLTAIEERPHILDNEQQTAMKRDRLGEIVGGSTPMQRVYDQIIQAADTDIPVLILGETGTGKDLVAHMIHRLSARREAPYLAVSLGALPGQLVASELFGHEKGAFTGAVKEHKGVFEQGSHGTVFLDEIDSTDEKIQLSLLRLIEQKKFTRLGGRQSIVSKARLIAASNENLEELVAGNSFRIDLFYRLDVFRIVLPALRERLSDIPQIVNELIIKYSQLYKRQISNVDQKCLDALLNYDWPGNIRELKNAIQRAVLVCETDTLEARHLPSRFQTEQHTEQPTISFKLGTPLKEIEREMILHALAVTHNNRKKAAELLGISRRAIYNKLEKYNL